MITDVKPKEQPILMSTPMVQALLAGTKTETRRDKNLKEINENPDEWTFHGTTKCDVPQGYKIGTYIFTREKDPLATAVKCPWEVGNILWTKETWRPVLKIDQNAMGEWPMIRYKADSSEIAVPFDEYEWFRELTKDGKFIYKSSMFMRRKFARIFLQITEIKLERLHDITEDGAIAEGIGGFDLPQSCRELYPASYKDYSKKSETWNLSPIDSYKSLWESINGEGSWEKNPWIWCVKFEKLNSYENKVL